MNNHEEPPTLIRDAAIGVSEDRMTEETEPVTMNSYQFNHPRNYIGYALAYAEGGSRERADELTIEYVVGGPDMARRGAQNMGLIDKERDGRSFTYSLSERGEWLVAEALARFDGETYLDILSEFDSMRGQSGRFIEEFPEFAEIAPTVVMGDPMIERFVELMRDARRSQENIRDNSDPLSTRDLVAEMVMNDIQFTGRLFIRDDDEVRKAVFGSSDPDEWVISSLDMVPLGTGQITSGKPKAVYRSPTTYQMANLLFHMGVLQETGEQAKYLDPSDEMWALEPDVRDGRTLDVGESVRTSGGELA